MNSQGVRGFINSLKQSCRTYRRRSLDQLIVAVRRFVWGNHDGSGYAIAGFQVQETDALSGAGGLANSLRVHADDFSVLADQHDLRVLGHLRDAGDFAVTFGGLYVDDAFASAIGKAVFLGGRALAVAVFGDGENQRTFLRDQVGDFLGLDAFGNGGRAFEGRDASLSAGSGHSSCSCGTGLGRGRHSHDVVFVFQVHAADAGGVATHGANCVFFEADGLAFVGSQEDDLLAVGEGGGHQFVALFDIDSD